jgi:hypothetical protein
MSGDTSARLARALQKPDAPLSNSVIFNNP